MSCLVILAHWSFCMLMIVSLLPTVGAVRNWLNKNKRGNTKWLTLTLLMDFLGSGCPMTWIQVTTRFAEPLGLIWRCRNLDSPVYKNIGSCSAWLGTCVLWVCELLLVLCGGGPFSALPAPFAVSHLIVSCTSGNWEAQKYKKNQKQYKIITIRPLVRNQEKGEIVRYGKVISLRPCLSTTTNEKVPYI